MNPQQPERGHTKSDLAGWIRDWMTRIMNVEAAQIADNQAFVAYGMDSIQSMMLVGDLEDHLARRLSPTLAWDHPTIEALATHLAQHAPARALDDEVALLDRIDTLSEEEIDALLKAKKPL